MKLKILGSGSDGNCYILEDEKEEEALVIECGLTPIRITQALKYKTDIIKGILLSHEHSDHAQFAHLLSNNYFNTIYMSAGTKKMINTKHEVNNYKIVKSGEKTEIDSFKVIPFDVEHNAKEPLGFIINHKESGNILFMTDTSEINYNFKNINNVMIECNWSKETLIDRDHNYKYHLSLDKCISILKKIDMKNVNNIVLIHLSNINSNKNMFVQRVKEETHIRNVFAADKIKTIEFNKNAF